jgi:hypothetical protein
MKIKTLLALGLTGLMFACAPSTKLEKSWADPSFNMNTSKPFTKILVVAPLKDENSQRLAEDKIVAELKKGGSAVNAVPSYSLPRAANADQKQTEEKLIADGFDGIVLMHLTDVEKSTSYVQGSSYGGYGRYGWYGYGYTPGYYVEDKTFLVETNFYQLPGAKLLWSGTTSSLNPTKFDKTMDQIIYSIKADLQKKGLIKKGK